MRSIDELYSEGRAEKLPDKIIILMDELNTFAPSGGKDAITRQIREIASKGRSRGTVLFGAEQFKSEVDQQTIGNCSVQSLGRTGSSELSRSVYNFLTKEMKNSITTLSKGELVLVFPTWRYPVKVVFPKPIVMKKEG